MKTTSKTSCLLLGAALLFSACGQNAQNPPAEFASMPIYEFAASQPAKVARHSNDHSIADMLADCESQFNRIRSCFTTNIGQPHR